MKTILFEASDAGYEYGWHLEIYEIDGQLYLSEESSDFANRYEGSEEISQEEALALMLENEEYEDDLYLDDMHSVAWRGHRV